MRGGGGYEGLVVVEVRDGEGEGGCDCYDIGSMVGLDRMVGLIG